MDAQKQYERRWWTLAVLCLSLVVIGLDNTILNVSLPTLVRELGASSSQLQWIIDSYVLVFAGLLLTAGALGDRFGRRLALNIGMVIFLGASLASAWADSANMLIITRGLMGIGGAFIMPSTLSIITNVFPPGERGKAISIWAGVAGLGVVFGPVTGGWLLTHFWWGSVFLVNVPVVLIALLGTPLIPESKDPTEAKLDPLGAVLSMGGLSTLVYALIEAPHNGWASTRTLTVFAISTVLLASFLAWERHAPHPMLHLKFFANPRFSAASLAVAMVFFALFGTVFLNAQYLQFVLGYSPLQAGARILPIAAMVPAARLSEVFVRRFGTKRVVVTGLLLVTLGLLVLSTVHEGSGYAPVAAMLVLMGTGMGLTMAPSTESIMGSLPLAKAGVGSAMNDTTRQVGGALGVAVIGSVLASGYHAGLAPVLGRLPEAAQAVVSSSLGGALAVAQQLVASGEPAQVLMADSLHAAAMAAFLDGMSAAVLIAAAVAFAGAVVAYFFLPALAREDEALTQQSAQTPAAV